MPRACLIKLRDASLMPNGAAAVTTERPHRAFALAVGCSIPRCFSQGPRRRPPLSTAMLVHSTAEIAEGVTLEPGAIVGREARIGMGTTVAAGAVVGYRVFIGATALSAPAPP